MKRMLQIQLLLQAFWKEEDGQDLIEYSLLVACLGLASAGLLSGTSLQTRDVWLAVNNALSRATTAAS